jgi:hypothetical protein
MLGQKYLSDYGHICKFNTRSITYCHNYASILSILAANLLYQNKEMIHVNIYIFFILFYKFNRPTIRFMDSYKLYSNSMMDLSIHYAHD